MEKNNKIQPGDKAPLFEGKDQQGNLISLNDYLGKKLILFFYPKDNTPGCTAEACNLRDNYTALQSEGFEIIGVSPDNEKSHLKFADKFQLPFPLIADTDKKILQDYGVWGTKSMYGKQYEGVFRTTFVINEAGIIEAVFQKVETANHAAQILTGLK